MTESDDLTFFLEEASKPTEWKIVETDDKLQVELHINPGFERRLKLKDTAPGYQITIETVEDIEVKQTITLADILSALKERGVTYGIDEQTIDCSLNSKQGGLFVIAKGQAPVDGEDGWLEEKVKTQPENDSKDNSDLSAIDYRERKQIPTVEKGQVLAIIHPYQGSA